VITFLCILQRSGVGDIIVGSGLVAKIVLAVITLLSVMSWTIAIDKIRTLRRAARQSRIFLRRLPQEFSIMEGASYGRNLRRSSLPRLVETAARAAEREARALGAADRSHARMIAQTAKGAMEREALVEVENMERNLIFLATTASVSPFLGLFGTVWGVMNAFLSMGQMGSASLTVVGPGVAEALITTVFGLGAAIPALVAYNHIVSSVRTESTRMERLISRVSDGIEKEILSELDSAQVSV
jgi:biopolymer transport protein TolQ